jgi:hypothetical protein
MHINLFNRLLLSHAQQRIKVFLRGMDLTIGKQTHQVQRFSASLRPLHGFGQYGIPKEGSGLDIIINASNVHSDNPTGTHVQVTYFRVSHHAGRQTDSGS